MTIFVSQYTDRRTMKTLRLIDDITEFLESKGFTCSLQMRDDHEVICTMTADGKREKTVLPIPISAPTPEEAIVRSESASEAIRFIRRIGDYPLIITEDRWHSQREMMEQRLLAHLELFATAYARNCEIRRIEKHEAQEFLKKNHSYGYAACRYRYGMFHKRNTGSISTENGLAPGTLIAVATFSNARKWTKGDKEIRSYEWTRYASLPFLRISGGMGKMLNAFIEEVAPDDIMSYADLEWSEGNAYKTLGFKKEGTRQPVCFIIDEKNWKRSPIKSGKGHQDVIPSEVEVSKFFRNFGSSKFRLKLTDYE